MTRKKLALGEKKCAQVSVRFTIHEYSHLQECADERRITLAEFIEQASLEKVRQIFAAAKEKGASEQP
jgi:hypothetical protein